MKNNEPTKSQVLEEMAGLAKDKVKNSWASFKQRVKRSEGFAGSLIHSYFAFMYLPYVIPSIPREMRDSSSPNSKKPKLSEGSGVVLSLVGAVATHHYLLSQTADHPSLFLIPVATNLASGAYEFARPLYKKARENLSQRIAEKKKEESLKDKNAKPKEYMQNG
jgi:hypothetical protein